MVFVGLFISGAAQTTLDNAVDFTVTTTEGQVINLFDILAQDKIVFLDFFNTTCNGCNQYAPHFQEAYRTFGCNEGNVFFLGIESLHSDEDVKTFDELHGIEFPSASGLGGGGLELFTTYNIQSTPTLVIVAPDGTILEQQIWGPTSDVIEAKLKQHGGLEQECAQSVDLKLFRSESLMMFPNPAIDEALVSFDLLEDASLSIKLANVSGETVLSYPYETYYAGNNTIRLMISELPAGFYMLLLSNEKGTIAGSSKLIIN